MLTIKYFPAPTQYNQYIQNTIEAIQSATGSNVGIVPSWKSFTKKPFHFIRQERSDIYIVNWLENSLRSKNNKISVLGIIKFFRYLLFFRLGAKKIIYVRHNLYPHNMEGFHAKLAKIITDIGQYLCSIKVTHSGHLIKQGYFYIPHPLYQLPEIKIKTGHEPFFVMFGRICAYKKFEDVINHWKINKKLIIAGSIGDKAYLQKLKLLAKDKNIEFDARFIPDEEAATLVKESNGVILTHADEDMIVSGSFFFAITLGVPVFAIVKPFFTWLKNEQNFTSLYVFDKPEEIVAALQKQHSFDSNVIKTQANAFFGNIATVQSWERAMNDLSKNRN